MSTRFSARFLAAFFTFPSAMGASALAQNNAEVVSPASTYRYGEFTMTVKPDYPCGKTVYATLTHGRAKLSDYDDKAAQTALRALASEHEKTCPEMRGMNFETPLPDGSVESNYVEKHKNWRVHAIWRANQPAIKALEAKARERVAAFEARAPEADHDLADYGFYKSELVGEGDGFKLYWTQDVERYGGKKHYAVVHEQTGDVPFFDNRDLGNGVIYTGPEFNKQLETLINQHPIVYMEPWVKHYIKGYHHPGDDRTKVLSENFAERPVFQTQLPGYWEEGKFRISPYGAQIRAANKARKPILSRANAIAYLGESAVAKPDDPLALPDFGPLAPEGPSAAYQEKETQIRAAALARGLVYKNDAFWSQFRSVETRRLFNAHYNWLAIGDIHSSALLMRYLQINSQKCRATIKDPRSFKLENITVREDQWGNTSSSGTKIFDMVVPGRFAPILEDKYKQKEGAGLAGVADVYSFLQGGQSWQSLAKENKKNIDWVKRSQDDVDRIMSAGPCGNPVQMQFEEMLYLDALGKNPETNTSISFANAASYSDAVTRAGGAPSVKAACLFSSDFGEKTMVGDRAAHKWCECIENNVRQNYPDRLSQYANRYGEYRRATQIAQLRLDRGQDHPENRIRLLENNCINR